MQYMTVYQKKTDRAACLPYYCIDSDIKLLFMKPSNPDYGGSYFQLAKGKVDPGYTIKETAKKEVMEEVGLSEENIKNMFFVTADNIKNYTVYLYAAEVIDPNNLLPFDYETGEVQWIDTKDISTKVRRCQHDMIYKAIETIIKHE